MLATAITVFGDIWLNGEAVGLMVTGHSHQTWSYYLMSNTEAHFIQPDGIVTTIFASFPVPMRRWTSICIPIPTVYRLSHIMHKEN